jgi:beta-lactamase class A
MSRGAVLIEWRRSASALAAAVMLALPAAPAAASRWRPDVDAAIAYARARVGDVRFAVRTGQGAWGWHATLPAPSASVLKAMLLVAYLDDPRVRGRRLRAADHSLIDPMIRSSDNTAATSVLAFVGAGGVASVAFRAGMRRFGLDPVVWGLSRIDASDQSRFFLHVDARVVPRHRAAAMRLLSAIVPSQRWGVGRVRPRGWALYFKGGWGAGTGAVEHQVALLRRGRRRVALAVLITQSPSHAYGKQTLGGIFARLLRGLAVRRGRSGRLR